MKHQVNYQKALQQYETALHLLNVTFPLIKDPKLLIGIINNISSSLDYGMNSILTYEQQFSYLPAKIPPAFQNKVHYFRKSLQRNKASPKIINLITQLKEIITQYKKSLTVFQRGNRFVICDNNYQLYIISVKDIKDYLQETKKFLETNKKIINKL